MLIPQQPRRAWRAMRPFMTFVFTARPSDRPVRRRRLGVAAVVMLALVPALLPGLAGAANWGDVEKRGCVADGVRLYVGHLKNTSDWEGDCKRLGARGPDGVELPAGKARCEKNIVTGMWGHWRIADPTCKARWGKPKKDQCLPDGQRRQWSSLLKNVPPGKNARTACQETRISIPGQSDPVSALNCVPMIDGMWGEFAVADDTCKPFYDPAKVEECSSPGKRHISSIIRNVQPGRNAMDVCGETSIVYKSVTHAIADKKKDCRADILGQVWGNWQVEDATCASHWQPAKRDHCVAPGLRQVSARLGNPSDDPEADCNQTSLTFEGRDYGPPISCLRAGIGEIWGEWVTEDSKCPTPYWDPTLKRDYCVASGKRQYSTILRDIPGNLDREIACRITPGTIKGQYFDRPTRCADEGMGGMWGEFDVDDTGCTRDERNADARKRDTELEAMDAALEKARDIGNRITGYDLTNLPAGKMGVLLRDLLDTAARNGDATNVAAFMHGGSGAFVFGYERLDGFAMMRDGPGKYTCYQAAAHAFTGGLALGGGAEFSLILTSGGMDAFRGDSHGIQSGIDLGPGIAAGVHWTESGNPIAPLPNVQVYSVGTLGAEIDAIEYARGYTWADTQVPCNRLP